MASSAEAARLASKTGLAAAATALVGAFYSSFDNKRSNNDDVSSNKSVHLSGHHALLPPPLHLSTAYCEKPKLSEAGNVIKEQEKEKPKSSDPADYAGGAAQFGASASDAEGLVRISCKEACLLEHIVGSNKSNFALQLPTNKHIQQYHGLFPRRQLWRPRLEYPLWDYEWDGRQPLPLAAASDSNTTMTESQRERWIRKEGVTRHVILIRHGQVIYYVVLCTLLDIYMLLSLIVSQQHQLLAISLSLTFHEIKHSIPTYSTMKPTPKTKNES